MCPARVGGESFDVEVHTNLVSECSSSSICTIPDICVVESPSSSVSCRHCLQVVASAEVEAAAVALLARIPAALPTYGIWEVALSVDDFRSLITAFSTAFTSRLVAETFIEAMYCICGDEMMEDNHVSAGAAGVVHAIVKALCEHGRCSEVLASRACRTLANFADSSGIGTNQIVLAEGGAGLSAIYSMMTYYAEGDNICYEVQYEACRALFKLLYGAYAADSGAIQVMQDGRAAMRLEAVFRLFPAEAELGNHVHNWGAIAYENLTDVAFPYVAR